MITEVTYLCWGCCSVIIKEEKLNTSLPVIGIEQWNLCPECIKKNKTRRKKE